MRAQTERLGIAQLSRAADLVSVGLSELKGATAPRLQLELLCARLLLPAADDSEAGLAARLDRLEHRVSFLGDGPGRCCPGTARRLPRPAAAPPVERVAPAPDSPSLAPAAARGRPAPSDRGCRRARPAARRAADRAAAAGGPPGAAAALDRSRRAPRSGAAAPPAPARGRHRSRHRHLPVQEPVPAPAAAGRCRHRRPSADAAVDLGPAAAMWPAVLEALKSSSRVAHTLAEGTVPVSRSDTTLVLAHPDRVRMGILRGNKGHLELLRLAVLDVVRLDVELDIVLDPDKAEASAASNAPEQARPPRHLQPRPSRPARRPASAPPRSSPRSAPPRSRRPTTWSATTTTTSRTATSPASRSCSASSAARS